jgi:NTP pyrophosphatase (non-canonical NTP hydrolase)
MEQKESPKFSASLDEYRYSVPNYVGETIFKGLSLFCQKAHADSYNRGWWLDPVTGFSLIPGDALAGQELPHEVAEVIDSWFPFVVATKIAWIHSEASEMLEAYRAGAMDDKIPEFAGITVEAGDVMIRVADLMQMLKDFNAGTREGQYDLPAAILAKMPVNNSRPDHALENRRKAGGKKF